MWRGYSGLAKNRGSITAQTRLTHLCTTRSSQTRVVYAAIIANPRLQTRLLIRPGAMPPLHPSRVVHGKASKKAACYSCVVTTTIVLSVLVLAGLLYAGVILGVRFRENEVGGAVRGADAPIGMLPASARSRAVNGAPKNAQLDDLTGSVSALMSAAGLPLSLPATPTLADLAGAVSAAVPMLQASREAAARAAVEVSAPASCPACPSAPAGDAATAGSAAAAPAHAVIVGMAMNIDVANLYRFVRSARDHVPGADIVLFVDDDSGERGAVLSLFGVEVREGREGGRWTGEGGRPGPQHAATTPPPRRRCTASRRTVSPPPSARGTRAPTAG